MSISSVSAALLFVLVCATEPPAQIDADREKMLLDRIEKLEQRIAALEAAQKPSPASVVPAQPAPAPAEQPQKSATGDSLSLPGFLAGTTFNVMLDGYYEYNFDRPAGHVSLLRPFDPTSNSFTVNQGVLVIERAPDVSRGRRFGVRLDLMFGQATESLAGNPANEPHTAPYRNIYQAFGTYIVPVGTGLSVDFGRFSSPIGAESSYAKDQIDYTRSLLFTALPFYHTGFRTSYKLSTGTTLTWMLVNGLNQSEDFNGFKSNHVMLSTSLSKNLSWTAGYYFGKEGRDTVAPKPDGRTHIADTYLTWNATPKLTLQGEGDYILSRNFANSAPVHLAGGAGYVKYQFAPAFYLGGRFEYVSDRGGYLSGLTQALKEGTLTAAYQPLPGFQVRWEFRRDYSNQRMFLTGTSGVLKREQNTALLGLLWWFGGKQGAW